MSTLALRRFQYLMNTAVRSTAAANNMSRVAAGAILGARLSDCALACPRRFSSVKPTKHDHSQAFSRPLTNEEVLELNNQVNNRIISGIVPGKMFMRHWIAGEQATFSILYRGIGLLLLFIATVWAGVYVDVGLNGFSWVNFALIIYVLNCSILHLHRKELMPLFMVAYFIVLFGY